MVAEIEKIESLTRDDVERIMRDSGLRWRSRNFRDYSAAKKVVFQDKILSDHDKFDEIIRWILIYLGLDNE